MRIEMLYPEVANLHGDNVNITYLSQCRPDAEIVRTTLTDTPVFVTGDVDLLYLGPMPESVQLKVIARLRPYASRLSELIDAGTCCLFTHNAFEVLGEALQTPDGAAIEGLGIFPLRTTLHLLDRYSGKVTGVAEGNRIVGYKAQFSSVEAADSLPGFLTADRGIGRNRSTAIEGVRRNNFIGTSLLGPLLITNPGFTKALLRLMDPDAEPVLAHEDLVNQAYEARLADFEDPKRWHPWERPTAG